MSGYTKKEIVRLMGKAIHSRDMIAAGDHILVSVSGGKDSLALLWLLRERIRRVPIDYRITAVHVDPGFGTDSATQMESFFLSNGFDYRVIRSDFGPRAHGPENLENPCFLCSRLRRKAIFDLAAELGCRKIAFGHHKDDLIETLFLNIFFGGSVSTLMPTQEFFEGRLKVIRPLYLVEESRIRRYAGDMGFPLVDLGCPSAGKTRRAEIREMLNGFYRTNRKVKGNIFHALQNVRTDYLP